MKILIVCHHAFPHVGGLEALIDLEIRGLAAAGQEVCLLTSDLGGAGRVPVYPPSVRVRQVNAWHYPERRFGVPYPIFSPSLLTVLNEELAWCDIVHAHGFMFMNSALAVLLAHQRGVPSVLTDHGGIQQFASPVTTGLARLGAESVGRLSCLLAKTIITYNGRVQQQLAHLGRRRDVLFMPNPVDRQLFSPATEEQRAAARSRLGWAEGRPKVLFVGRLIEAKGLSRLLGAAGPEYDLVFCGPGDVSQLGPLPRPGVEYLAPRPQAEVVQLYHAADVLALPADVREGFPLVVQEAVSCGLPVVLGYDPGFEPYRQLPDLVFCQTNSDSARQSIMQAVAIRQNRKNSRNPSPCFPSLEEWTQNLLGLFQGLAHNAMR